MSRKSPAGHATVRILALCVALFAALGMAVGMTAGGSSLRAGRDSRHGTTRAFLMTRSVLAIHYGEFDADCPAGFDPTVEENFLATLSPAERARILKPENANEYAKHWKDEFITGPGGENVCNNPKSFAGDTRHPAVKGIQSKIAFGLNLDGTPDGVATAATCGHAKFEGLNGDAAVDNQLYRAIGCSKRYRGAGENVQPGAGLDPFIIELRGVDNPENDDRVEVGIYSTDDVPIQAQTGGYLPDQTFHASSNPRWRNETTGRIVNRELVTDVTDVHLRWRIATLGQFGEASENEFRRARLKLRLESNGEVTGLLGGYRPLTNISTSGYCCKATASTANIDCASEYKTLALMADGDPDPETGQCTTISAAQKLVGIPSFLVHGATTSK
jgi:hypothetical protein